MSVEFKIGDRVKFEGVIGTIRTLMPDMNSNGRPVTADVRFPGMTKELSLTSLKKSEEGPSCHYCGCPASGSGFGFFDEPVCWQCGGD